MLHPSYSEIMDNLNKDQNSANKVSSRYTIVIAAAKRARQLIDLSQQSPENSAIANKPVSSAVEKIYQGKVLITVSDKDKVTMMAPKNVVNNQFSEV